jgi:hypothetical protein
MPAMQDGGWNDGLITCSSRTVRQEARLRRLSISNVGLLWTGIAVFSRSLLMNYPTSICSCTPPPSCCTVLVC